MREHVGQCLLLLLVCVFLPVKSYICCVGLGVFFGACVCLFLCVLVLCGLFCVCSLLFCCFVSFCFL